MKTKTINHTVSLNSNTEQLNGKPSGKVSKEKKVNSLPSFTVKLRKKSVRIHFKEGKQNAQAHKLDREQPGNGIRLSIKKTNPKPQPNGTANITRTVTCSIDADNFNCSFNTDLADLLKPGMIYNLKEIASHSNYKKINLPRNPIVLYADRLSVKNPRVVINDPDESTIAVAMEKLRAHKQDAPVGKNALIKINEIFTESDFYFHVNAGGHYLTADVNAFFTFSKTNTTHKYLIDVTNELYALNIEMQEDAAGSFFKDKNLKVDKNWVMVTRVTYGQRILIAIESDTELSKEDFGFDASFEIGFAGAHVGMEIRDKTFTHEKTVNYKVWGTKNISLNGLSLKNIGREINSFLSKATNYRNGWGYPLRYQLSFLNGNIAMISSEPLTDVSIVSTPLNNSYHVSLSSLNCKKSGDSGNAEEYYGSVRMRAFDSNHKEIIDARGLNKHLDIAVAGTQVNVAQIIKFGDDDNDDYIEVGEGSSYPFAEQGEHILESSKFIRIFNMPSNGKKAYFLFEGSLNEDDAWPNADDHFNGAIRKVMLSDVIKNGGMADINLEFNGGGSVALLQFEIKPNV